MGIGNPFSPHLLCGRLELQHTTTPLSYTLVSRGIGTNVAIPVADLAYDGGVAGTNACPHGRPPITGFVINSNTPTGSCA